MARKISEKFLQELKEGRFSPVLQAVQDDDTLDLELRGECIIIYYRGGKILTLKEDGMLMALDANYQKFKEVDVTPSLGNFEDYVQKAKKSINSYVSREKNILGEKEIQQLVVRENNYSSVHKDTDYFIVDTEYEENATEGRFDAIALQWNSTSIDHRQKNVEFAFIEIKQGVNSINGDSGLAKHALDYKRKISSPKFEEFKKDMLEVFLAESRIGIDSKS